jgi:hypothetical protein
MVRLTRRGVLLALLALAAVPAVIVFGRWRDASNRGGQQPAEPFRIAGNLYYVGANDVSARDTATNPGGSVHRPRRLPRLRRHRPGAVPQGCRAVRADAAQLRLSRLRAP